MSSTKERVAAGALPPDADACREQLDRILASADFQATDRDRRFLAHVVGETLAGREDRIKAYSIALEVFGRDASFDPQNDPIVRVEAGHLRRALDRYYLGTGSGDPVEITIPKGGYVPRFDWRSPITPIDGPNEPAAAAAAPPGMSRTSRVLLLAAVVLAMVLAAGVLVLRDGSPQPVRPDLPRLLVEPFEDLAATPGSAAIARGLTQEVVGQITKFKDIVVVGSGPAGSFASGDRVPPRYTLAGSVDVDANELRLQVRVVRESDDAVLWAESYSGDLEVSRLLQTEADIAQKVATTLAQPYGVIFQADTARRVEHAPDDWKAYACTLGYYAYRANLDRATHPKVRECLEEAVARFPDYATGWALLSQTYIDEFRFHFPADPREGSSSIDRALAAARRAVQLDPTNTRALEAEMFALYFAGDVEAALKVGAEAMTINPNDSELMGEYGFRLALSGEWSRGCPLIEEARARNPGPLGYYEGGLALCAYFGGDYPTAVMWIRKAGVTGNPNFHLIAAVVLEEGGFAADAAAEVAWLKKNAPRIAADPRKEISSRLARAGDIDRAVESLKKAGLSTAK